MNDPTQYSTVALAAELIACPSVTPEDGGCQDIMIARLESLGFHVERLRFGEVDNFWARRGQTEPLFVFAGHTDVVPPGPLSHWHSDPFAPVIRDDHLYGRGAADMKGSLAAMITACERFLFVHPRHRGSIGFLVTSDEEGPSKNGTVKVVEHLAARGEQITACLVGEPSSVAQLGDTIKNGRRGSLSGRLRLVGIQGHVAHPHLARNPLHPLGSIITALVDEVWDKGNESFPPTSFQISNLNAGTGAGNVIPGDAEMRFNFRFSPEVTAMDLRERVKCLIDAQLNRESVKTGQVFAYELEWELSGLPFLTRPGELTEVVKAAILEVLDVTTTLSTSGGTSDARFIAPTGAQVVELGPLNETIHKVNERVAVADLERLSQVYERILIKLLV